MNVLKHLIDLNKAGWQCDHVESGVDTIMPMASFYVYYPLERHCIYAAMPIDAYMNLVGNDLKRLPTHLITPEILSGSVAQSTCENADVSLRPFVPALLGLYMATTITGQMYFQRNIGKAFNFICIMYPDDKKRRNYIVRPFITPQTDSILSLKQLENNCNSVMEIDRAKHKDYFRFLKKPDLRAK